MVADCIDVLGSMSQERRPEGPARSGDGSVRIRTEGETRDARSPSLDPHKVTPPLTRVGFGSVRIRIYGSVYGAVIFLRL